MKLASSVHKGRATYGCVSDAGVHPVEDSIRAVFPTLLYYLNHHPVEELALACGEVVEEDEIIWLPPIIAPGKIICAGMNYRKTYPVEGTPPPDPANIVLFARHPETLIGHGAELEYPTGTAAETFD